MRKGWGRPWEILPLNNSPFLTAPVLRYVIEIAFSLVFSYAFLQNVTFYQRARGSSPRAADPCFWDPAGTTFSIKIMHGKKTPKWSPKGRPKPLKIKKKQNRRPRCHWKCESRLRLGNWACAHKYAIHAPPVAYIYIYMCVYIYIYICGYIRHRASWGTLGVLDPLSVLLRGLCFLVSSRGSQPEGQITRAVLRSSPAPVPPVPPVPLVPPVTSFKNVDLACIRVTWEFATSQKSTQIHPCPKVKKELGARLGEIGEGLEELLEASGRS